ncbi:hypothetical protein [Arthrobacter sp. QXT-31]|uniref:hypothetical protein n=1 Tax=Arthrobacter sp. QXT-31 TaxID=1357915 RepID=UPI0009719C8F|nr:hypothetical protein [Arthrobacter sp. QXT-31]APX03897.1 hypothetical protein BWQ92_21195 [Arthrobacter sp. QXT-31]
MCYSSCEGWRNYRKEAARKAKGRPESKPAGTPDPQVQAEESRMWAYLARLQEAAEKDRIRENA